MSAPSSVIAPPDSGYWPASARSRLVLPTPLRPSTQVTLAGLGGERHAAQRLRRAVGRLMLWTFSMLSFSLSRTQCSA